jgi:hypothetical protein
MALRALFISLLLFSGAARAQNAGIFNGKSLNPVSLVDAFNSVPPGSIIVLGENHGYAVHQAQHIAVFDTLR